MHKQEPNWRFHTQVIAKALDILDANVQTLQKCESGAFLAQEAPLAIEEARESLMALALYLSGIKKAA